MQIKTDVIWQKICKIYKKQAVYLIKEMAKKQGVTEELKATDTNRRRTAVKPMAVFLFRQVFKKSLSREYNRSGRKVISYIGCNFFMNYIDKKTWHVYN